MPEITRENVQAALMGDAIGARSYEMLPPKFKAVLLNSIVSDLEKCERANGKDFVVAVWATAQRAISTANWEFYTKKPMTANREMNPFPVWRAIYRKASKKADQEMKREPKALAELTEKAMRTALGGEA